jgi:acyl-CoA synthetase (AMP-forming)/AMP-acid ligase II
MAAQSGNRVSEHTDLADCHSLDELVARSAALWPERPAIVDGERTVSHRQVGEAVNAIAATLLANGLVPGMTCAVLMGHTWTNFAALVGIGRAGLVALPLNAKLTPLELHAQMTQADIDAVILDPAQLARVASVPEWLQPLSFVGLIVGDGEVAEGEQPVEVGGCTPVLITPEAGLPPVATSRGGTDVGTMWFTGGSTGAPKLVLHARRSPVLAIRSWIERLDLTEHDRGFALNFCHISTISNTGALLAAGGSVILIPEFRVPTILSLVERHRATILITLAMFVNLLVRDPLTASRHDSRTLRVILIGGSPTDPGQLVKAMELLPHVEWGQAWAQTELCSGGTLNLGDSLRQRPASVGRPLSCVDAIEIRDDRDVPVPPGTVGEVCVRGPAVMLGYHHDGSGEAASGAAGAAAGRLVRTGDLGFVDTDGYLHLVGRKREMIIRGGENLFPSEIEAVIASHPAVGECAVVGIPDTVMTEVPVAFVVPVPQAALTVAELEEFAGSRLSRLKRPVAYELVEGLPRNSIGKIIKAGLREAGNKYSR